LLPEIFSRQYGVERNDAAIGGAEDHGQQIDEQVGRDRERSH
jgi:hypothetical protein